jgi:hypothetical protein
MGTVVHARVFRVSFPGSEHHPQANQNQRHHRRPPEVFAIQEGNGQKRRADRDQKVNTVGESKNKASRNRATAPVASW